MHNALLFIYIKKSMGSKVVPLDGPWLGHSSLQMFIFQILILRFLKEVKSSKAFNYLNLSNYQ